MIYQYIIWQDFGTQAKAGLSELNNERLV
jgi:hypothetical protein